MANDVIMPQMGESVAEGTITKWLKKVGDKVERDEPLFEISTDKVDAEIPSPAAGILTEILVPEGTTVQINTKVAVVSGSGAPKGATPAPGLPAAAPAPLLAAAAIPAPQPATTVAPAMARADMDAATLRRLRSSPLVRRIAEQHQVDISTLQGTGLSGRVTKSDILEHIQHLDQRLASAAIEVAPQVSGPAPVRVEETARAVKAPISFDIPANFLATPGSRDNVQAMTPMRRKIAEHMLWSKRISAHVNSFLEVDMTKIVRLREQKKDEFLKKTGEKLTYMPFIMQATVSALRAFPDCNASIVGDDVVYHKDIHLGIAVALEWGLIVPVVRQAGEKNLLGLSRSLNDLASRARSKKLLPDELNGGTFTITNPGSFGSLTGTPIINQPQVAILGLGAINKRPWVIEGPEGDSIAIRHIMMLSMSYDHRLVDGAIGARFLNHVRNFLESYDAAQLE